MSEGKSAKTVLLAAVLEFAKDLAEREETDPGALHEAHALVIQAMEVAEWGLE